MDATKRPHGQRLVEVRAMRRSNVRDLNKSKARLNVEPLEERVLLSHGGPEWPHPERITVSFVPDGTKFTQPSGSTQQSVMQQKVTASYDWNLWKKEALRGLYSWARYANINFALVSDDGSDLGSAGSSPDHNVQGDSDFGDIRIGMWNLTATPNAIAGAFYPPPNNTTTYAGDITLNALRFDYHSPTGITATMAHEAGHALGLSHIGGSYIMGSTIVDYQFTQQDIDAIQAIYGPRQHDVFDQGGRGNSRSNPINVNSRLDSKYRYTFNGVDITTTTDRDWYKIRIPQGAGNELLVRMHTQKLSLLAPRLVLYDANGNQIKAVNGEYGKNVTIRKKVKPGQVYYVKATGRGTDEFSVGAYALMIRISNAPLLPVQVPNTATPAGDTTSGSVNATAPGADPSVAGDGFDVRSTDAVLASGDAVLLARLMGESLPADQDRQDAGDADLPTDPVAEELAALIA